MRSMDMTNAERGGAAQLPAINMIPIMFIVATLSISLSVSTAWFIFLLVVVVALALLHPSSFKDSFASVLVALMVIGLFFLYSYLSQIGEDSTASSLNVASWALIVLILAVLHREYGMCYFGQGARQLLVVLVALGVFGVIEGLTSNNPLSGVFPHILGSWRMGTSAYRASSIFSHPIPFSHAMECGMVIALLLRDLDVRFKIVAIVTFLVAVIESQTRSAVLIACALVLFFLIKAVGGLKSIKVPRLVILIFCALPFILIALFASGALSNMAAGLLERIEALGSTDVSVTQRSGAADLILSEFFSRGISSLLIGNGLASSNSIISGTTISIDNFNTVDNNWLTVLFDFGVFVFVGMALMTLYGFYSFLFSKNETVSLYGGLAVVSALFMFFYSFSMWKGTLFLLIVCYFVLLCPKKDEGKGTGNFRGPIEDKVY